MSSQSFSARGRALRCIVFTLLKETFITGQEFVPDKILICCLDIHYHCNHKHRAVTRHAATTRACRGRQPGGGRAGRDAWPHPLLLHRFTTQSSAAVGHKLWCWKLPRDAHLHARLFYEPHDPRRGIGDAGLWNGRVLRSSPPPPRRPAPPRQHDAACFCLGAGPQREGLAARFSTITKP